MLEIHYVQVSTPETTYMTLYNYLYFFLWLWNYLALIYFNLRLVEYVHNLFASFEDLNLSTSASTHQTPTERDVLVGTDKNLDLTSHYIL